MTRREAEVLGWLAAFEGKEHLVYERGTCYFGLQSIAPRVAFKFMRNLWISQVGAGRVCDAEHYRINQYGRAALAEHLGIERESASKKEDG